MFPIQYAVRHLRCSGKSIFTPRRTITCQRFGPSCISTAYLSCKNAIAVNDAAVLHRSATLRILRNYRVSQVWQVDKRNSGSSNTPFVSSHDSSKNVSESTDPFPAKSPKLDIQYKLVAGAQADVEHFMKSSGPRPKSTSVSSTSVALDQTSDNYMLPHPIWDYATASSVVVTHVKPPHFVDRLAYLSVKALRWMFDLCSGYSLGRVDERGWLNRIVFLETVAGVPGMVGAMVHHLNSLRRMERDYGWIHILLAEAENERMHLMTAMVLKKPTTLFRMGVLMTQGLFLTAFTLSYLLSPRFAHRMVAYLEEEAVKTYTNLLLEIDKGSLPLFEHLPAPPIAKNYWELEDDALLRDVILAIRADESHHREVNHNFADISMNMKKHVS